MSVRFRMKRALLIWEKTQTRVLLNPRNTVKEVITMFEEEEDTEEEENDDDTEEE